MNFLEFPLWVTNKKEKEASFVIETKNGKYMFDANPNIGVPDAFDALLLYYFLFLSQNKNSGSVSFNSYEVCNNLKLSRNTRIYKRIERSLNIWRGVSIKFDGCFYFGNQKYVSRGFSIFDYEIKEETGKKNNVTKRTIELEFSNGFLKTIQESNFFKNIDLNLWIALKNPLARRLYEYLLKQFLNKDKFSINSDKLFPKIGLDIRKYPSDTEKQMNSIAVSIRKINDFDKAFNYQFEFYINKEGEFICVLRKEKFIVEVNHTEVKAIESDQEIRQKLREYGVYKNSISNLLKQHSVEVLSDTILDLEFLAKQKSQTNKPIRNMGSFLRELLPETGQEYEFSDEYMRHQKELKQIDLDRKVDIERREAEKEEDKKRKQIIALEKKVDYFIASLSKDEKVSLEIEAKDSLKSRGVKNTSLGYKTFLLFEIRKETIKKYNIKLEDADLTNESIKWYENIIKQHKKQTEENNILTVSQFEEVEKQAREQAIIDLKVFPRVTEREINRRVENIQWDIAKKLYGVEI